jgi:hypothetical protein
MQDHHAILCASYFILNCTDDETLISFKFWGNTCIIQKKAPARMYSRSLGPNDLNEITIQYNSNLYKTNIKHGKISLYPRSLKGEGVYCFTSVRPSFRLSKIFFVTFFSVTVDGRNLIFGHKHHIGIPYNHISWSGVIVINR